MPRNYGRKRLPGGWQARAGSEHPALLGLRQRCRAPRCSPSQGCKSRTARLIQQRFWLHSGAAKSRIRPIVFNLSAFKLLLNNTVYLWLIESKNFAITDKQGHSASHVICIFKDQDFFLCGFV